MMTSIKGPVVNQLGGREGNAFMCLSSSADADASSGSHVNVGGEVWNPDRSRPHSYRPITLAFSLNNLAPRMSRHRPVPLHVPPPSSKTAFVQLRGRGGFTPLSSLPPLPCPPE